jgi:hypothetical protein
LLLYYRIGFSCFFFFQRFTNADDGGEAAPEMMAARVKL